MADDYDSQGDDVETLSTNQIWIKVQNNTGYDLVARSSFADWGDFAQPPEQVPPYSTGDGGRIISSRSPFTGSAGMVGYKIVGEEETLHLLFLASNPYLSMKDNRATAAVSTEDRAIHQANYNWLYYEPEGHQHYSKPFEGKTLTVSCQMGQADDASAVFTVYLR